MDERVLDEVNRHAFTIQDWRGSEITDRGHGTWESRMGKGKGRRAKGEGVSKNGTGGKG
jgi:hypothetical protein